jgi:tyrosinase
MPFNYLIVGHNNNQNKAPPMQNNELPSLSMSRREFLKTTAAAATVMGAATLPFGKLHAQGPAKYRRLNISSPEAKRTI